MKFTRRSFLKTATLGAAALSLGCGSKMLKETNTQRVVVLGGGYGGSTAAKYIKKLNPEIEVVLVDRNTHHVSCALSNEVIFGMRDISTITMPHKLLTDKYGVICLQAEVEGLDPIKKVVKKSVVYIPYNKLIVSPGISMDYDEANGFDSDFQKIAPHAWIAGEQTKILRDRINNLPKGSTILLRTPKVIYRCPPGPYERASLMGYYAKQNGCKVVVIDPNPGIASKAPLFKAVFSDLYKDSLTYIPGVTVKSYDKSKNMIITDKGDFTADLINFIPDQKAGEMAFKLGLVPEGKKWAPIKPDTFESELANDVYVIGDAIDSSFTQMPKSGTIANGMGKLVAENIVREYAGRDKLDPIIGNSCYSLVSHSEAIYIATVYDYNPETRKIAVRNNASAIPPTWTEENFRNMQSWGANILSDTFM